MELGNPDINISLTGKIKESVRSRRWRYMKQAIIVINAAQWVIQLAMLSAWLNPAIYDFKKIGTNFYGDRIEFSETQLDMLGSLPSIGGFLGSLYAWPVSWWGRRYMLMYLVVPNIVTWAILGLAPTPAWMLVGRVLSGFCSVAAGLTVNTYAIEIPDVPIRGAIAMITSLSISLGILITVILGLFIRYYHFSYLGIITSVIAFVSNYFLPESPAFLVTKNREIEARQVLHNLRSPDHDIEQELEMLQRKNSGLENSSFISILRQPEIMKSLLIVLSLFFFQAFSGIYICYNNTSRIFIETETNINENMAVVSTIIFQFIGTVVASFTIEKFGRRHSMVVSSVLVSIFLYIMGTYTYMNPSTSTGAVTISKDKINFESVIENVTLSNIVNTSTSIHLNEGLSNQWKWVPLVCMMGVCFSASLGLECVPYILSVEYFPTTVRAKVQSILTANDSLLVMLVFGLYSTMKNSLTIPGLYFFYATCGFIGFIFSLRFVRETAGQDIG